MTDIAIVAFDNFTDLDVILPYDLLTRVNRPDWSVKLLGGAATHKSTGGMELGMQGRWEDANQADAVLFGRRERHAHSCER